MNPEPRQPDDTQLVRLFRAAHQVDVDNAARRHPAAPEPHTGTQHATETQLHLTALYEAQGPAAVVEPLRPWLPAWLEQASVDPLRTNAFLDWVQERRLPLAGRRLRTALRAWLAEFAGRPVEAVPPLDTELLAAVSVTQAVQEIAQTKEPWAAQLWQEVQKARPRSPKALLSLALPPELAGNPAVADCLRSLFITARRNERVGCGVMECEPTR